MAAHHAWGLGSKSKIGTLDERWIPLLDDLILACPFDVTVVWGYRGRLAQERAFAEGSSTKRWPESLHNHEPSVAVDLAPYVNGRIDWGTHDHGRRFYIIAGLVFALALKHELEVRWGGDWDRDGDLDDQTFVDLGHFELKNEDTAP